MLTKNGVIKRTTGDAFVKIRCTGIRALSLREDDELVFCTVSSGEDSIVIATAKGQGIRFHEKEVRQMGRQASGVRGIKLKEKDFVVGMEVAGHDAEILVATSKGYGKRTRISDFRVAHRGGVGVRTIPTGDRNGYVIGIAQVGAESQILMIDEAGKIIRISPQEIRTLGRQAQGVRLIRLDDDHLLSSIAAFQELHTAQAVDPNYKAPEKLDASQYNDDEEEADDIEVEMIEDEAAEEAELDDEAEEEMEEEE
jgi:DNA gyrase subunit A